MNRSLCKSPIKLGIVPVRALSCRSSKVRLDSLDKSRGMLPTRLVPFSEISSRFVRAERSGIGPEENLFWDRKRYLICVRELSESEMSPVKSL